MATSRPAAKRETDLPFPLSPYAAAKAAGEFYCQAFWATYGLETVAIRYFNVFGPRQDPQSQYSAVIPIFITAMLAGRQPVIFGDGRQSRDFSFVGNVVHANLWLPTPRESPADDQRGRRPLDRSAETDRDAQPPLGPERQPRFAPPRAGDVRESQADITLARSSWATSRKSLSRTACGGRSTTTARSPASRANRTSNRPMPQR